MPHLSVSNGFQVCYNQEALRQYEAQTRSHFWVRLAHSLCHWSHRITPHGTLQAASTWHPETWQCHMVNDVGRRLVWLLNSIQLRWVHNPTENWVTTQTLRNAALYVDTVTSYQLENVWGQDFCLSLEDWNKQMYDNWSRGNAYICSFLTPKNVSLMY